MSSVEFPKLLDGVLEWAGEFACPLGLNQADSLNLGPLKESSSKAKQFNSASCLQNSTLFPKATGLI